MPQIYKDEIITRLQRIEDKIDQGKLSSIWQLLFGFGFGLLIASVVSFVNQEFGLALTMFLVGLVFMFLPMYIKKA